DPAGSAPKRKAARPPSRASGRVTPACTLHQVELKSARPPAQSMPELFDRMMEGMARNPTGAFADVLREQEGAALRDVTLSPTEERAIGRRMRETYLRRAAAQGYRVSDDPARLAYLRDLVEHFRRRLVHRQRYPRIDVTLVKAP